MQSDERLSSVRYSGWWQKVFGRLWTNKRTQDEWRRAEIVIHFWILYSNNKADCDKKNVLWNRRSEGNGGMWKIAQEIEHRNGIFASIWWNCSMVQCMGNAVKLLLASALQQFFGFKKCKTKMVSAKKRRIYCSIVECAFVLPLNGKAIRLECALHTHTHNPIRIPCTLAT